MIHRRYKEQVDRALEMYIAGEKLRKISRDTGISVYYINKEIRSKLDIHMGDDEESIKFADRLRQEMCRRQKGNYVLYKQADTKLLIGEYKNGICIEELSNRHKINIKSIKHILKNDGIDISKEIEEYIIRMNSNLYTSLFISNCTGLSEEYIRNVIKANNRVYFNGKYGKDSKRATAIEMYKSGKSLNEIRRELKISLGKLNIILKECMDVRKYDDATEFKVLRMYKSIDNIDIVANKLDLDREIVSEIVENNLGA